MKTIKQNRILGGVSLLLCTLLLALAMPLTAFAGDEPATSLPEDTSDAAGQEAGGEPEEGAATGDGGVESMFRPNFDIEAPAAYIVNGDTGVVLYEKNAEQQYTSASLVKMMTTILALENLEDIDGTTITMGSWVNDELYGKNASTADIRAGETLTVRELLYAMLLPSANEAALMVAGYVAGDMGSFVAMMNERAAQLGCTGTVFTDPNGLSTGNQTTAKDMYLILKHFASFDVVQEVCQNGTYFMDAHEAHAEGYYIQNTNRLSVSTSPYYSMYPAVGGAIKAAKTGSLGEWQNFACMAQYNGLTYYSVVLNSPNEADSYAVENGTAYRAALLETGKLLDWAFNGFTIRAALDTTSPVTEVRVKYSTDDDAVKLLPTSSLSTMLPVGADDTVIRKDYQLPEYVEAPVQRGDVIGRVTLSLGGRVIGTSDLIAAKDIERNSMLYNIERLKEFVGTIWFKLIIAGVVVLAVLYVGLMVYLNRRKKRRNPYADKRRR